mmetsp:Transcript_54556/g.129587  ORF Transcript_54556/g.129587 Transcript_54556/m.129587 type:complete len:389 (+) Transcript_54556:3938-5104(+)
MAPVRFVMVRRDASAPESSTFAWSVIVSVLESAARRDCCPMARVVMSGSTTRIGAVAFITPRTASREGASPTCGRTKDVLDIIVDASSACMSTTLGGCETAGFVTLKRTTNCSPAVSLLLTAPTFGQRYIVTPKVAGFQNPEPRPPSARTSEQRSGRTVVPASAADTSNHTMFEDSALSKQQRDISSPLAFGRSTLDLSVTEIRFRAPAKNEACPMRCVLKPGTMTLRAFAPCSTPAMLVPGAMTATRANAVVPDASMLMPGASCCVEGLVTAKVTWYVVPARSVVEAHTGRTIALLLHSPWFVVVEESPQKRSPAETHSAPDRLVTVRMGYASEVTPVRPVRVILEEMVSDVARVMLPEMRSVRVLDTETKGLDCESVLVDHSTITT